jgi:RNA polymerase sigma-70 factor (ECF subfamily)
MTHELSPPEQWLPLHGDVLYRYGVSRVRDSEVAEDLVQETLLAALKAKANYSGQSAEQTWLIGILKHKIIDYFRKASREQVQEYDDNFVNANEDDYFDQKGGWQVDFSSWSKPDKSMEQEQFMTTLQQCVSKLSPKMAQLFVLREFDGMSSEEICELMSISTLNNFWVMLSRIRVQLRHCLDINWVNQ